MLHSHTHVEKCLLNGQKCLLICGNVALKKNIDSVDCGRCIPEILAETIQYTLPIEIILGPFVIFNRFLPCTAGSSDLTIAKVSQIETSKGPHAGLYISIKVLIKTGQKHTSYG